MLNKGAKETELKKVLLFAAHVHEPNKGSPTRHLQSNNSSDRQASAIGSHHMRKRALLPRQALHNRATSTQAATSSHTTPW